MHHVRTSQISNNSYNIWTRDLGEKEVSGSFLKGISVGTIGILGWTLLNRAHADREGTTLGSHKRDRACQQYRVLQDGRELEMENSLQYAAPMPGRASWGTPSPWKPAVHGRAMTRGCLLLVLHILGQVQLPSHLQGQPYVESNIPSQRPPGQQRAAEATLATGPQVEELPAKAASWQLQQSASLWKGMKRRGTDPSPKYPAPPPPQTNSPRDTYNRIWPVERALAIHSRSNALKGTRTKLTLAGKFLALSGYMKWWVVLLPTSASKPTVGAWFILSEGKGCFFRP